MKVLVTGACGFVGSHVVEKLLEDGHSVWCVDDLSTGKRENIPEKVEFAQVNVGNWWDLVSEFVDCEPEAIIHLAAQASIFESFDNPIRDGYSNVMGTLNVLRAAQKIGAKRVVFSSTSAVYCEIQETPLSEDSLLRPASPYGISKLAAESYLRTLMPNESVVLRFGNVYGPRQVPIGENQVVARMIQHFEKGNEFYIFGDGEQKRDYVYVEDVARACVASLTCDPGVFNIASGEGVSVNQISEIVSHAYGVDYNWEHNNRHDSRRTVTMNIDSARRLIPWEPTTSLDDGIQKTISWWKK